MRSRSSSLSRMKRRRERAGERTNERGIRGREKRRTKRRRMRGDKVWAKIFGVLVFAAPNESAPRRGGRRAGPGAQNCLPSASDCLQITGHSRVSRTDALHTSRAHVHTRRRARIYARSCEIKTGRRLKRDRTKFAVRCLPLRSTRAFRAEGVT